MNATTPVSFTRQAIPMDCDCGNRRGELATFLVDRRRRIDAYAGKIGDFPRHLNRIGRTVTQEEMAEVLGVSRVWYAALESGAAKRPSPALLNRVATALRLSPEERRTLFDLGIPELYAACA